MAGRQRAAGQQRAEVASAGLKDAAQGAARAEGWGHRREQSTEAGPGERTRWGLALSPHSTSSPWGVNGEEKARAKTKRSVWRKRINRHLWPVGKKSGGKTNTALGAPCPSGVSVSVA